jgi:hypothetical protein
MQSNKVTWLVSSVVDKVLACSCLAISGFFFGAGDQPWHYATAVISLSLCVSLLMLPKLGELDDSPSWATTQEQLKTKSYWRLGAYDDYWRLFHNGQAVRCYTCGRDIQFHLPMKSTQIACKCGGPSRHIPFDTNEIINERDCE